MFPSNASSSPLQPNALDSLVEMVGLDDPDFLIELIDTFLVDSAELVETMLHDWQAQNVEAVMRAAHSLKSTSATFQAMRLSQLAADLEGEMRGDDTGMDVVTQINAIRAEHSEVKTALLDERSKLG